MNIFTKLYCGFLGVFCVVHFSHGENEPLSGNLSVEPSQCVSLNQGNVCYVNLEISWNLPEAGNYCVYSSQQHNPIKCWENKSSGKLIQEFESAENLTFTLQEIQSKTHKASAVLEIAWVYQKNKRAHSRWRMF